MAKPEGRSWETAEAPVEYVTELRPESFEAGSRSVSAGHRAMRGKRRLQTQLESCDRLEAPLSRRLCGNSVVTEGPQAQDERVEGTNKASK
jgi:hypothetical protein